MGVEQGDDRDWSQIGWVLLVLAAGAAVGALLGFVHPLAPSTGPAPPPLGGTTGSTELGRVSGVLSIVDLALLVALIVVYVRTYRDTRARFALGLVLFLSALVVQSAALSLPILVALGFGWAGLGFFFFLSTLFETLALSVFLYLSLD